MFREYEKQCVSDYVQTLQENSITQIEKIYEFNQPLTVEQKQQNENSYINIESYQPLEKMNDNIDFEKDIQNPYEIMLKFVNWEIMDLEAIIFTLNSKSEMDRT